MKDKVFMPKLLLDIGLGDESGEFDVPSSGNEHPGNGGAGSRKIQDIDYTPEVNVTFPDN